MMNNDEDIIKNDEDDKENVGKVATLPEYTALQQKNKEIQVGF